ncbi:MAG: ATP-binding protein, partial [Mycobacterium sp.]|nr:ATP-binding protein [Mycobacterium sp.]
MKEVTPAESLHHRRAQRQLPSQVPSGNATGHHRRASEGVRLHGRSHEVDTIRRLLADAAAGIPQLLVIEGPRGIGKSRLLSETVALGRSAGFVVSTARPASRPDTHKPHHRTQPVLIAADNPAGTGLFAPSPIHTDAQAVVLTKYPNEASDQLVDLRLGDDRNVLRLNLNPLDDISVSRMVEDILCATPDQNLLAHVGSAGGNPRLVVELVTGLAEERQVLIHEGQARLCGRCLPARVVRTVRSWL